MAMVLKVIKRVSEGRSKWQEQSQEPMLSGEQLYDNFKIGTSFYVTNLNLKSPIHPQ